MCVLLSWANYYYYYYYYYYTYVGSRCEALKRLNCGTLEELFTPVVWH